MKRFYLGTNMPCWLWRGNAGKVPLFVSAGRLREYKKKGKGKKSIAKWALDSGGFTELRRYGTWKTSAKQYAQEVEEWHALIGNMEWAAIQDWMCEPDCIKITGKDIKYHQAKTIESYVTLKELAPAMPWIPILQGYTLDDFLCHVNDYLSQNIDLVTLPLVGLGSVCRRQSTKDTEELVNTLSKLGLRLHGFGVKTSGLKQYSGLIESADSMSWSYNARRNNYWLGCAKHWRCNSCPKFARLWWANILQEIPCPAIVEEFLDVVLEANALQAHKVSRERKPVVF